MWQVRQLSSIPAPYSFSCNDENLHSPKACQPMMANVNSNFFLNKSHISTALRRSLALPVHGTC